MVDGHKDSSGKFHPHNDSSSSKLKSSDGKQSHGNSINHSDVNKLKEKKSFHLYSIYEFSSNGRSQVAVVKAKNIDDAEKYVMKNYLTKEGQDDAHVDGDGDDYAYISVFDDNADEIRAEIKNDMKNITVNDLRQQADELGLSYDAPDFHEDDVGMTKEKLMDIEAKMIEELRVEVFDARVEEEIEMGETNEYGWQIEKDDDEKESFKTIYGGDDFVDLINPEKSGYPSHQVIKDMNNTKDLAKQVRAISAQRR